MMRRVFSSAALAVGLIAGQAGAQQATYKITGQTLLSGAMHVSELCSNHLRRMYGTPLGSRLDDFCKAAEGMDTGYNHGLELCRQDKEKRQQEYADIFPKLNSDQAKDLNIKNLILDTACPNRVIEMHHKKIADLFDGWFAGGMTIGYSAP